MYFHGFSKNRLFLVGKSDVNCLLRDPIFELRLVCRLRRRLQDSQTRRRLSSGSLLQSGQIRGVDGESSWSLR